MTDKKRAAMKAALKFAEFCWRDVPMNEFAFQECEQTIDVLRDALAEPEVEPVAWGMPSSDGSIVDCIHPDEHAREEGGYTAPLYAAPSRREWRGLTDEEIRAVIEPLVSQPTLVDALMLVSIDEYRAIEAALRERNT